MNTLPFLPIHALHSPASAIPRPGRNTRLTANMTGYAYSAAGGRQSFAHPWKPALGSAGVTLARGSVNDIEARIKDVPLSGDATQNQPQPTLLLDPKVATANGESWVCVEITVDPATDGMLAKTFPQIVHTASPRSLDPLLGRTPLCLIVWQKGKPFRTIEGVYFNLLYARVLPAAGHGVVKHVFY